MTGREEEQKLHVTEADKWVDTYVPEPDGKYAWVICGVIFFINFVVLGLLYSLAVFLLPISEDLDVGRGTVSLIFSTANGLVFLVCHFAF